jgi:hypothetical protein
MKKEELKNANEILNKQSDLKEKLKYIKMFLVSVDAI